MFPLTEPAHRPNNILSYRHTSPQLPCLLAHLLQSYPERQPRGQLAFLVPTSSQFPKENQSNRNCHRHHQQPSKRGREGGTRRPASPAMMETWNRFLVLDPEGRDEGVAEIAAGLVDPEAADAVPGPGTSCAMSTTTWRRTPLCPHPPPAPPLGLRLFLRKIEEKNI